MAGSATDVLRWVGGTTANENNPNTAANWVTHAGSPGAGIPSAGESILFDHRSAFPILGTATTTALANCLVTDGCSVNIGADNSPLIGYSFAMFDYAGRGDICNVSGSMTVAMAEGHGLFSVAGGTTGALSVHRGKVVVGASAVLTGFENYGGDLTINHNATAVTTGVTVGGATTTRRTVNTMMVAGRMIGNTMRQSRVRFEDGAGVGTVLDVLGGDIHWMSAGTIALLNGYSGSLRTRGNPYQAFTITESKRNLATFSFERYWAGGAAILSGDTPMGGGSEGSSESLTL